MTHEEATAVLQCFGEGIDGSRDMYSINPTHDDWHAAVAALTGIPYRLHLEHHVLVAEKLGVEPPPAARRGRRALHAEHSTAIMRAIARMSKEKPT